jgi:AAA domain, putative AbiEii toxin, Type IV TA system
MSNWSVGYDLIDKTKNPTQVVQRTARFKNAKWARDEIIDRPVLYFGIQRTVPAGERREFKKFATVNYQFTGSKTALHQTIQEQVAMILGKDVSRFQRANISEREDFYIGGNGTISYSEFHFGAGESSVIRMVSQIETAPENALVLIEEIENGLHPVAVRRMVEYLMNVATRRSIQSIFTSHSEDALSPLPPEAIWSSIDGKAEQGRVSIDALRAITGRIDETMAIFVEDAFAKEWVEATIRNSAPARMDEIGVYAVSGESRAVNIHLSHKGNPALEGKLKSLCIVDGDSSVSEDLGQGIVKLPGKAPELEVFNYVNSNLDTLAMQLAVALHLSSTKDGHVKNVVKEVSLHNRDSHLVFSQVGVKAGLIPANIVSSAFIALWMEGNPDQVKRIADFIEKGAVEAQAGK